MANKLLILSCHAKYFVTLNFKIWALDAEEVRQPWFGLYLCQRAWKEKKLKFNPARGSMEEGSRRIDAEFRKLLRWWLHSMKVEDSSSNV